MPVRIKVDEDLSQDVAALLSQAGIDAVTVHDEGLAGSSDDTIWSIIAREERWLLTADKGFADIRRYPPSTRCRTILLRLERESRAGYVALTARLIESVDLSELAGHIIVVTHSGVRIHRV